MIKKKIGIIFLFIFNTIFSALNGKNTVYIIVHGTWALGYQWHMPTGNFFKALETAITHNEDQAVCFLWSGKLDHESRVQGALCLTKLIESYPKNIDIIVIAHSHGTNVALLTSHFLAIENKQSIKILYGLGTPVDIESYSPNMQHIDYFYNLFSFNDFVQPILGFFGREYPPHDRIANIRIMINDQEPDHSSLHDIIIGKWISHIHIKCENFHKDTILFGQPGVLYFFSEKPPFYEQDTKREQFRRNDEYLCQLIRMFIIQRHI